jgi:hypothetical protein
VTTDFILSKSQCQNDLVSSKLRKWLLISRVTRTGSHHSTFSWSCSRIDNVIDGHPLFPQRHHISRPGNSPGLYSHVPIRQFHPVHLALQKFEILQEIYELIDAFVPQTTKFQARKQKRSSFWHCFGVATTEDVKVLQENLISLQTATEFSLRSSQPFRKNIVRI